MLKALLDIFSCNKQIMLAVTFRTKRLNEHFHKGIAFSPVPLANYYVTTTLGDRKSITKRPHQGLCHGRQTRLRNGYDREVFRRK